MRSFKIVLNLLIFLILLINLSCSSDQKKTPQGTANQLDIKAAREKMLEADQKILLYAIDGLTWKKINAYRKLGLMPNFDRLLSNGSHGVLESIMPMYSISLWTTMVTGVDFDTHGVQYFYKIGNNGTMLPYTSLDRKVKALWNIMDDVGEPSGWVSWWASWPAEPIKGFDVTNYFIADFGFKDIQEMSLFSPPEISSDLKALKEKYTLVNAQQMVNQVLGDLTPFKIADMEQNYWGEFRYGSLNWVYVNNKNDFLYNFLRNNYRNDALALNTGIELRNKMNPRLAGIYMSGIDGVSHKFWKYDTVNPDIPDTEIVTPEEKNLYGKVLSSYYQYHDQMLGQLMATVDDKTTIIVVSDHGFQYVPKSNYISMSPLLYELGYLKFKDGLEKTDLKTSLAHEVTVRPWDQKRYMRINVRENDFKDLDGTPLGAVSPGKEMADVRDKLIADLAGLKLKNKGIKLFTDVRKPSSLERAENENQGDVLAEFNRAIFDEQFEDDIILPDGRTIPLDLVAIRKYHSGSHDQFDGVIIISGPLAKKGFEIKDARTYDVAPTILTMLGLPVANYMLEKGKVLEDALDQTFLEKYPVYIVDSYGEFKHALMNAEMKTSGADDAVREMLQGLGYMQ
jgi:predicted AlkP superfamily phosphohydrolase/phosphomutase